MGLGDLAPRPGASAGTALLPPLYDPGFIFQPMVGLEGADAIQAVGGEEGTLT